MTTPLHLAERLAWVEGSALMRRDLADGVAAEDALLAAHVRAVHDTHGVALGLTAVPAADRRSVLVTPGYAITCIGAPVWISTALAIAAPSGAPGTLFDLVLHAPVPRVGDACSRATTCDLRVAPNGATLAWHVASPAKPAPACTRPDPRTSVLVASFTLHGGGTLDGPQYARRRGARVLERPHVASAVLPAGAVTWTTHNDHLVATIDMAAAGFSRAPVMRTWIAAHDPWPDAAIGAMLSTDLVGRTSFRAQLLLPGVGTGVARTVAGSISVGWLGVEPVRGCPPGFSLAQIVAARSMFAVDRDQWSATLASFPGFST